MKVVVAILVLVLSILTAKDYPLYCYLGQLASGFLWPSHDTAGSPVVIIPGTGASQLEGRIHREEVIASYCEKNTSWRRLWLDVWLFISGHLDCWCDNIKLVYDPLTGRSSNTPGVETRVPGWGHTDTIEYLDTSWTAKVIGVATYAAPFVKELVSWGYERGVSVVGAPYDWRFAPHSQEDYFNRLKTLIEDTYHTNNDKKVTLFAHSLGCMFGLYFLNGQSQAWKDRHIHAFIAAAGPWEGSALEYQVYASGMNFGINSVDPSIIRHEQRTQENNAYMLPRSGAEWTPRDIFVRSPSRNYTANDIEAFMNDVGFPIGNDMMKHFSHPKYSVKHPMVPFHCLYSPGSATPAQFIYDKDFQEQKYPSIVHEDGDGTVTTRSLQSCLRMNIPGKFSHYEIPNTLHNDILGHDKLLRIVKDVVYS